MQRKKELLDLIWDKEDVTDLMALDGWDDDDLAGRASEMLSFRIDEAAMDMLRGVAADYGVGHTILARELLLAGLARLRQPDED